MRDLVGAILEHLQRLGVAPLQVVDDQQCPRPAETVEQRQGRLTDGQDRRRCPALTSRWLLDVLGQLAQVVRRLDDTLMHLPQTWELGSDDRSPAGTHVTTASFTLRAAGAALDDAHRHANEAHSALSHLKIR